MANVNKNLHNDEDELDQVTDSPKRGIAGAAGGTYVGPIVSEAAIEGPTSATHATAAAAGGVEDTTGYRESDTYGISAADEGGVGGADVSNSRATGRTAYTGQGAKFVQVVTLTGTVDSGDEFKLTYRGTDTIDFTAGTDMTAAAIQSALRTLMDDPLLTVTGSTDAGPFIISHSKPVGSGLTITEVTDTGDDLTVACSLPSGAHQSWQKGDGGFALGSSGRGTSVDGETVDLSFAGNGTAITRPTIQEGANPAAGVVSVGDGTALITMDLHADDVTAYAGAEALIFSRGDPNTDEDGDFVARTDLFDTATEGTAQKDDADIVLAAATYAVYARFVDGDGNVGPLSPRSTVVVS